MDTSLLGDVYFTPSCCGGGGGGGSADAVLYTAQTLTDAQKTQARTNIGAGTSNFSGSYADLTNTPVIPTDVVKYTAQSLNSVQKAQARTNIGVAADTEVAYIGSVVGTV